MSRKKKHNYILNRSRSEAQTYMDLPTDIRMHVQAYVMGSAAREKLMSDPATPVSVRKRYQKIREKIEKVCSEMDARVVEIMLQDIAVRRGYDKSQAHRMMARPTYYRQKNRLERGIAEALGLIWAKKAKDDNQSK